MTLRPPPEGEGYLTLDDLVSSVNSFAGPEGYRVVKQRTKSQKGEIYKAYIGCDKGRGYVPRVSEENRKRNRTSRKTDCPFVALASLRLNGWSLQIRNGEHNHPPTMPEDRPGARKKLPKPPKTPLSQTAVLREEIRRLTDDNRLLLEENGHLTKALTARRARLGQSASPAVGAAASASAAAVTVTNRTHMEEEDDDDEDEPDDDEVTELNTSETPTRPSGVAPPGAAAAASAIRDHVPPGRRADSGVDQSSSAGRATVRERSTVVPRDGQPQIPQVPTQTWQGWQVPYGNVM